MLVNKSDTEREEDEDGVLVESNLYEHHSPAVISVLLVELLGTFFLTLTSSLSEVRCKAGGHMSVGVVQGPTNVDALGLAGIEAHDCAIAEDGTRRPHSHNHVSVEKFSRLRCTLHCRCEEVDNPCDRLHHQPRQACSSQQQMTCEHYADQQIRRTLQQMKQRTHPSRCL